MGNLEQSIECCKNCINYKPTYRQKGICKLWDTGVKENEWCEDMDDGEDEDDN